MTGERRKVEHGFGPIYYENSRILIMGSFPSVISREESFYYAHPQNRFWKVIAAIAGDSVPSTIEERIAFLKRNGIALYDVVESCTIVGSSDSSIEDVKVTDLTPILRDSAVGTRIYTNGTTAYNLYMKYIFPRIEIEAVKLPSTSPANAGTSEEELIRIWSELIGRI